MKNRLNSTDNPLPGPSTNGSEAAASIVEKPHKEKCYGNKERTGGAA